VEGSNRGCWAAEGSRAERTVGDSSRGRRAAEDSREQWAAEGSREERTVEGSSRGCRAAEGSREQRIAVGSWEERPAEGSSAAQCRSHSRQAHPQQVSQRRVLVVPLGPLRQSVVG
jgi:hypothetical protein